MRAVWDYDVEELYYVKSKNKKTLSLFECDEYGNVSKYQLKSELYPYNNTSQFNLVKNKQEI